MSAPNPRRYDPQFLGVALTIVCLDLESISQIRRSPVLRPRAERTFAGTEVCLRELILEEAVGLRMLWMSIIYFVFYGMLCKLSSALCGLVVN